MDSQITALNNGKLNRILIGLIAVNLCITLPLAFWLNIWADEAYSLMTSGKDLEHAIHQSIHFEKNAPLYYLFLQLWRQINSSIFFSRLPSIIFISLTIYIAALVSKRFLPKVYPAWISALIAFHPFAIWAAVEIRLYALSILLSALLLLLFHDAYLESSPRSFSKGLFIGVATLSAYTLIPVAFLFMALGFVLLVVKRQVLRDYILGILSVALLASPLLFIIYERLTGLDLGTSCPIPGGKSFTLFVGLGSVGRSLLYFFLPLRGTYYHSLPIYLRVAVAILVVALLLLALLNYRFAERKHWSVWLVFLTASLTLSIGMAVSKTYGMSYAATIFIPCLLTLLSALFLIFKKHRHIVFLYMAVVFIACGVNLFTNYSAMAKPGDFDRVISYIKVREKPNQPILVFPPGTATTLAFLYQGSNAVVALPEPERFDGPDNWCKYFLKDEKEILAALTPVSQRAASVWLVTERPGEIPIPEYRYSFRVLDDFVNKYYQVESSQDFYGSNVRLLHRKGKI